MPLHSSIGGTFTKHIVSPSTTELHAFLSSSYFPWRPESTRHPRAQCAKCTLGNVKQSGRLDLNTCLCGGCFSQLKAAAARLLLGVAIHFRRGMRSRGDPRVGPIDNTLCCCRNPYSFRDPVCAARKKNKDGQLRFVPSLLAHVTGETHDARLSSDSFEGRVEAR